VPYSSLIALQPVNWLTASDHGALVGDSARAVIKYLLDGDPDAAYLAKIPDQVNLQRAADAPVTTPPQREVVVYAPESSNLVVQDASGHVADGSTQTFPGAYWFTDGDGRYLLIPNPPTGEAINVTVTTGVAVPVGIIDLSSGAPEQSSEVLIGGQATGSSATITIGSLGGQATTISVPMAAVTESQVKISPPVELVLGPTGDVLGVFSSTNRAMVQSPVQPVLHSKSQPPVRLVSVVKSPVKAKMPGAKLALGLLGLLLLLFLIIWLLLLRAHHRAADRTSGQA